MQTIGISLRFVEPRLFEERVREQLFPYARFSACGKERKHVRTLHAGFCEGVHKQFFLLRKRARLRSFAAFFLLHYEHIGGRIFFRRGFSEVALHAQTAAVKDQFRGVLRVTPLFAVHDVPALPFEPRQRHAEERRKTLGHVLDALGHVIVTDQFAVAADTQIYVFKMQIQARVEAVAQAQIAIGENFAARVHINGLQLFAARRGVNVDAARVRSALRRLANLYQSLADIGLMQIAFHAIKRRVRFQRLPGSCAVRICLCGACTRRKQHFCRRQFVFSVRARIM